MPTVNTYGLAEENVAPDENEVISHFIAFIEKASVARNPQGPILRFNQARTAGCVPTCHLDIPYWSTTPYLFGPGRAVKYITRPCSTRTSTMPAELTDHYLRDALRAHLAQEDACFDFMIQFQVDSHRMPIEDASVEWKEEESLYRPVARIRIPRQRIDDDVRVRRVRRSRSIPGTALPSIDRLAT
jgi:hypothetical protein